MGIGSFEGHSRLTLATQFSAIQPLRLSFHSTVSIRCRPASRVPYSTIAGQGLRAELQHARQRQHLLHPRCSAKTLRHHFHDGRQIYRLSQDFLVTLTTEAVGVRYGPLSNLARSWKRAVEFWPDVRQERLPLFVGERVLRATVPLDSAS